MQIRYRNELYKLLPKKPVVAELGCAEGNFSLDILKWDPSLLYMVDVWETIPHLPGDASSPDNWHRSNYNSAMAKVKPYGDRVKVLRGFTWSMAQHVEDGSLDLLYLDACHSYECVLKDLNTWYSKVKDGGIIAGHDYLNKDYGVFEAVQEFCNGKYQPITIHENKNEDAGFYFTK